VVPDAYHSFFEGSASVAGALVGLLFVAISISPEKVTGEAGTAEHRIRAAAAFSALVNALVISLFALLPQTDLGTVALAVSLSGLASTVGLVVVQLREPGPRRPRQLVLVVFLFAVYGDQLDTASRILHNQRNTGAVHWEAVLVVVCLLIGIARAWELLGARSTGLIAAVHAIVRERLDEPR
jgi:hypothetical protein